MIVIFFFMQLVLVNISAMLQGGIMKDIFKVAMLQMERSSDINNNIKKNPTLLWLFGCRLFMYTKGIH